MGLEKRKYGRGGFYESVHYNRDKKATFNIYSVEELESFKTLMKSIGGSSLVAYELYKMDNGFRETHNVWVTFITICAESYDKKAMILTPEELSRLKYKYKHNEVNKGNDFEYTEIATDVRKQTVYEYFKRNPYLVSRYKKRVYNALKWNTSGDDNTKKIAFILNKLASKLNNKKKAQILRVDDWLVGKDERPDDYIGLRTAKDFIDTITATNNDGSTIITSLDDE